jgi:large subunit ribosomal protein L3
MVHGIIGRKLGMVQIFDESGHAIGVSVIQAGPCTVVKKHNDSRVQLGFEPAKEKSLTKPVLGQFKKAGTSPFRFLKEFDTSESTLEVGQEIKADIFERGEVVKIIGTSKGKGFAGVIKRHNFGGGRETHGSRSHRIPGSVGQCAWPSRIFKGRKMPGRLGGVQVTAPTVQVVDIRPDENLLFVRGPIPGPNGGIVFIRKR